MTLAAECSNRLCRKRPRLRIDEAVYALAATLDPSARFGTAECYDCGTIYTISIRDVRAGKLAR